MSEIRKMESKRSNDRIMKRDQIQRLYLPMMMLAIGMAIVTPNITVHPTEITKRDTLIHHNAL